LGVQIRCPYCLEEGFPAVSGPYHVTAFLPEAVAFVCKNDACTKLIQIAFVPPPVEPWSQGQLWPRAA
jgi:hypothetical protein